MEQVSRVLETFFPLTSAIVLDVVRLWFGCGSDVVRMWVWLGCGADVVRMWFGCGSDVGRGWLGRVSDLLQTVLAEVKGSGF